jgi:hypothetical protein
MAFVMLSNGLGKSLAARGERDVTEGAISVEPRVNAGL